MMFTRLVRSISLNYELCEKLELNSSLKPRTFWYLYSF